MPLHYTQVTLTLSLAIFCVSYCVNGAPSTTPIEVVYTGEGCECPQKLGYQLNVPKTPKAKPCGGGEHGYRVDKPVQTKAKISYSFDFTVEEPRTPPPSKLKPAKLFAKIDRVTVNKADCVAKHKPSCGCSSCVQAPLKHRYVNQQALPCPCQQSQCQCAFLRLNSPNAIPRSKRDLHSRGSAGSLFRKRMLRQHQLQERLPRYVKLYHKDLAAQQKLDLLGLADSPKLLGKRKSKKTPAQTTAQTRPLARWLQQQQGGSSRRLSKRDIKGEYDLMERERSRNIDLTAPEIIQFLPETLQPNFKLGQCQMGCVLPRPKDSSSGDSDSAESTPPPPVNTIHAKRDTHAYGPPFYQRSSDQQQLRPQLRSPLTSYEDETTTYKYVDDVELAKLLSTTSVPDPQEGGATPLQFAGDLEAPPQRSWYSTSSTTTATRPTPLRSASYDLQRPSSGSFPVEHVSNAQLDTIISGIVYRHPQLVDSSTPYGGLLIDAEPLQQRQTTAFLKKLFDGRLGGWSFDSGVESDDRLAADYATTPRQTYGYNSHIQDGYTVHTYNVPPISEYLRSWF